MKAYLRKPPVDTMSMAAMAMVLLRKVAEDFRSFDFCVKYETLSVNFKELKLVLFESLF